jgi:diguanylate cyclase (GGDEF)-like protein/PAS domain S-box-containing protein
LEEDMPGSSSRGSIQTEIAPGTQASSEVLATLLARLELQSSMVDRLAIISETDPRGVITHVNDNFCRISGYTREELIGRTHALLNSGFHPKSFWTEMYATVARGEVWQADVRNRAKDGSYYWVKSANAAIRGRDGKLQGYMSLRLDVSESRELQTRIAARNLQLDAVLEHIPAGVSMFDSNQCLVLCNDRYVEMYGLPQELSRAGTPLRDIIGYEAASARGPAESEEERARRVAGYLAQVARGQPFTYTYHLNNGRAIRVSAGPMPDGGWVDAHEDITHELNLESRIAHLALHDGLTDLANRALLRQRFEQALATADGGQTVVVLSVDLDRFKDVNDDFGHAIGDALLRAVAERLQSCVRRTDTVARVGGDEFVVLQISKQPHADGARLSERLIREVCAPYHIDGHEIRIGASIGIAISPQDGTDPDKLLKSADVALYHSKSGGRGIYHFYRDEMTAQREERRARKSGGSLSRH